MSLRELRQKRGYTQRQLADKIDGVGYGRIADYENGRRPIEGMSLGVALKICDALRVSNPRKLLEADKPKENTSESYVCALINSSPDCGPCTQSA